MKDMELLNQEIEDIEDAIKKNEYWQNFLQRLVNDKDTSGFEKLEARRKILQREQEKEKQVRLLKWLKELKDYKIIDKLAEIGNPNPVSYKELKEALKEIK